MPTDPARGPCHQCEQLNAYTRSTCGFCGQRLLWADTFAATSGEKCPACQHFNPYLRTTCAACGLRLPWADAPAARRNAQGTAEPEQKSLALMIFICGVLFTLMMCYMFYSVAPRP